MLAESEEKKIETGNKAPVKLNGFSSLNKLRRDDTSQGSDEKENTATIGNHHRSDTKSDSSTLRLMGDGRGGRQMIHAWEPTGRVVRCIRTGELSGATQGNLWMAYKGPRGRSDEVGT